MTIADSGYVGNVVEQQEAQVHFAPSMEIVEMFSMANNIIKSSGRMHNGEQSNLQNGKGNIIVPGGAQRQRDFVILLAA